MYMSNQLLILILFSTSLPATHVPEVPEIKGGIDAEPVRLYRTFTPHSTHL